MVLDPFQIFLNLKKCCAFKNGIYNHSISSNDYCAIVIWKFDKTMRGEGGEEKGALPPKIWGLWKSFVSLKIHVNQRKNGNKRINIFIDILNLW